MKAIRQETYQFAQTTKQESRNLFCIEFEPKGNTKDIFNLEYLQNNKIQVEPPPKKNKSRASKTSRAE